MDGTVRRQLSNARCRGDGWLRRRLRSRRRRRLGRPRSLEDELRLGDRRHEGIGRRHGRRRGRRRRFPGLATTVRQRRHAAGSGDGRRRSRAGGLGPALLAPFGGKLLRRKSRKNHSLVGTDERLPRRLIGGKRATSPRRRVARFATRTAPSDVHLSLAIKPAIQFRDRRMNRVISHVKKPLVWVALAGAIAVAVHPASARTPTSPMSSSFSLTISAGATRLPRQPADSDAKYRLDSRQRRPVYARVCVGSLLQPHPGRPDDRPLPDPFRARVNMPPRPRAGLSLSETTIAEHLKAPVTAPAPSASGTWASRRSPSARSAGSTNSSAPWQHAVLPSRELRRLPSCRRRRPSRA